jgi:hypothetical protein
MQQNLDYEREIRAARNQAMFRLVSEKLTEMNESFSSDTGPLVIACECADAACVAMVELPAEEYREVRRNPRHFAVHSKHICPDVEKIVAVRGAYTIVENTGKAADVAEETVVRANAPTAAEAIGHG